MSKAAQAIAQRWELLYRHAITGGVPRRSFWVAVVVGSLLNLINQGDKIISGQPFDLAKLALTYMVPYFVSTYGAVSFRLQADRRVRTHPS